ncbi:pyridoxal phosphate-dependent aminotransferase [Patescibacteria group bacterium]|nr:pyridoxal phosphate-dependent aminotransferase [Patescibacteria group bacterium]MBU1472887.1 pyridoxal phosphate-dependent aminotransferase [Patescibacteria group bacterium]MBU2459788.1 pyridoxal phosphate-dependent aminotransferase [Patescibacteria group bacterium]MBU2544809.1 pyridoxal phosphate-dependent aminotransferase [Patescibacteria group bacterium]
MTDVTISDRLKNVPSSPIRNLVPLAQRAKKSGVKVYHLNIGDPDIQTPCVMLDVLKNWKKNPIAYGQSQGEPVFLEALVSYYHKIGFPFITYPHIQVTSGGSEAISMAMFAVAQPGEEIVTFEPLYANYNSYAAINSVQLIPVTTAIQTGFHLSRVSEIERHITNKTRAILYCNPNNPTGTVYTKEEIDMLVALAKKYHLFLLADEVYREFIYDGLTHVSLLSYMENIPDKAIVLDSMSKRYSLCGARLGALVSLNAEVMAGALRIAQGRLSAGLIDQHVASKLTEVPDSYVKEVQTEYSARRDVLYEGLKRIPGIVIPKPEGAFYAIVGLPVDDAEKFCKWLLTDFRDNNETVMLAPASGFYATFRPGQNEVRIAYVLNTAALKRCIDILAKALRQYPGKTG